MNPLTRREFLQASVGVVLVGCNRPAETGAGLIEASGVIPVEGAQLRYVIEGEGVPCLVLGHSQSQRGLLSAALRSRFRFHFLDLRHDAESHNTLDVSHITLDTYLQDIDAARRELGLDRTALFGHSHHAYLAFEYARSYPQFVTRVIATACPPRVVWGAEEEFWEADASDERKAIFEQNLRENPEDVLAALNPQDRWIRTYQMRAPKLAYDPRFDPSPLLETVHNDAKVFLHLQLVILKDYDVAARPARIRAPVFLALGRFDYTVPYTLWHDRRDVIPELSYHLFQRSGHFPMVEEQELFDNQLVEWLDRAIS
jgi:proline iminopeptidase